MGCSEIRAAFSFPGPSHGLVIGLLEQSATEESTEEKNESD
jgi:hypothetical protein